MPLSLVVIVFAPASLLFAVVEQRFSAAFEFGRMWAFISDNVGNYLLAVVVYMIARFLGSFGVALLCIGVIFTGFWSFLITAHGFAQVYRLSQLKSETMKRDTKIVLSVLAAIPTVMLSAAAICSWAIGHGASMRWRLLFRDDLPWPRGALFRALRGADADLRALYRHLPRMLAAPAGDSADPAAARAGDAYGRARCRSCRSAWTGSHSSSACAKA